MKIDTDSLAMLAEKVVDAKLLTGALKGKHGWNDGLNDTRWNLESAVQNAVYQKDWADVITYATMLAAIDFNKTEELSHGINNQDGISGSSSTTTGTPKSPSPVDEDPF